MCEEAHDIIIIIVEVATAHENEVTPQNNQIRLLVFA
jgi:hypothetical protein